MKTIDDKFQAFHAANPEVFEKFREFAELLIFKNRGKMSGALIMERVRWEALTGRFRQGSTFTLEGFKIDNNFTALYVRKLVAEYPVFGGKFETRKRKVEAQPATVVADEVGLLEWAVGRWKAEVGGRPLVNKNRRPLDDTWRQVIRFAGGSPDQIIGPSHDALAAAQKGGAA